MPPSLLGELFDFWKMQRQNVQALSSNPKSGLVVNDTTKTLASNCVVELELLSEIKPDWLEKGERIPLAVERLPEPHEGGEPLAYFHVQGRKIPAIVRSGPRIIFNFNPTDAIDYLLHERYCTKRKPIYAYLPFHYHKIPFRLQLSRILSFHHRMSFHSKHFPSWPVEKSVDALRYAFMRCAELAYGTKADADFWKGKKYALCLSHDIDTAKGLAQAWRFAELEESRNLRATYNVVSNYYPLDKSALSRLSKAGHEIGWHGYNHDNKLPFLPESEIRQRMLSGKKALADFNVSGMRSPCLLTSPALYKAAAEFFKYDSSIPDSAVFISGASNFSGCCTVFPYNYTSSIVELPLTLQMDADLQYLGYSPQQILEAWLGKLEWIKRVGGIVVLNTHTDPHYSGNDEMLGIYEKFLSIASKDRDAMHASCAEAAARWRAMRR